jgi:hypothetical protein
MARRKIWQIGCVGIDAVLGTSFEPDELVQVDRKFEELYSIPDHPGIQVPHGLLVYGAAHRACHSDGVTSRAIERRLNAMHARVIQEFESGDKVDVLSNCYLAASENHGNLAGCLWAVLTDPRPELRQHDLFWVQGIMLRSLRCWMDSRLASRGGHNEAR